MRNTPFVRELNVHLIPDLSRALIDVELSVGKKQVTAFLIKTRTVASEGDRDINQPKETFLICLLLSLLINIQIIEIPWHATYNVPTTYFQLTLRVDKYPMIFLPAQHVITIVDVV